MVPSMFSIEGALSHLALCSVGTRHRQNQPFVNLRYVLDELMTMKRYFQEYSYKQNISCIHHQSVSTIIQHWL